MTMPLPSLENLQLMSIGDKVRLRDKLVNNIVPARTVENHVLILHRCTSISNAMLKADGDIDAC